MTEIANYDPARGSMAAITGGHLTHFQDWAKVVAVGTAIPDALRGKPADVFITVMHGLDLGLRPMQALNLVYVVKGRPSLSAEGMRALILDAGHDLEITADDKKATVRARRAGSDRWVEATFTIEQAKKAKLGGANWDAYAEDMLVARATTRLAKRYFGDITNGLDSTEDLLDRDRATTPALTLADAAAARQGIDAGVVDGQVVDDEAEAARLRAEVEALERAATGQPPADHDAAPAAVDVEEPDEPSWPNVTQPAGATS